METPGELYDKYTILKLKEKNHAGECSRAIGDAAVQTISEFHWLKAKLYVGAVDSKLLRRKAWKIRAVEAGKFSGSLNDLEAALRETNSNLWDAEVERDRLFMLPDPTHEQLLELRDVDRGEQQLNQDRNAIIEAIDAQLLKEITA